jgi:hypothetical protein
VIELGRCGPNGKIRWVSSCPSPIDVTGIEGHYVVRGWTRPGIVALIGWLVIDAVLLLTALLLHDRLLLAWVIAGLVLTLVSIWRGRRRTVSTTISREGITIDHGSGPQGRTHLAWADAREVYVAGAWQAHSSVRTSANKEVPLPGLDRAQALKLAEVLRAGR